MRMKILLFITLLGGAIFAFAAENSSAVSVVPDAETPGLPEAIPLVMQHPFYIGGITGYGNTDWSQLVAQDNEASYATPVGASGSGAIIGAQAGYQITQYISIEMQYIRYPDSELDFGPNNAVYNVSEVNSITNYYAIIPKVSVPFDNDRYAAFGTLGGAMVSRSDVLAHIHDYRPTFGFGVSAIQWAHWNISLAFNYTPGTGVAAYNASAQYIPYLYAGEVILTYRI